MGILSALFSYYISIHNKGFSIKFVLDQDNFNVKNNIICWKILWNRQALNAKTHV